MFCSASAQYFIFLRNQWHLGHVTCPLDRRIAPSLTLILLCNALYQDGRVYPDISRQHPPELPLSASKSRGVLLFRRYPLSNHLATSANILRISLPVPSLPLG